MTIILGELHRSNWHWLWASEINSVLHGQNSFCLWIDNNCDLSTDHKWLWKFHEEQQNEREIVDRSELQWETDWFLGKSYLNPPEFNEYGIFISLTIVNFNFFPTLNQQCNISVVHTQELQLQLLQPKVTVAL